MAEIITTKDAVNHLLSFKARTRILYASGETATHQSVCLFINGFGQFVITINGALHGQSDNAELIIKAYNDIVKVKHVLTGE